MVKCGGDGKYLGLPYIIRRSKKQNFQFVRDKVAKKVGGLDGETIVSSGKELLIKVVLQPYPCHAMFLNPERSK